jgi:hypothetical protein
MRFSFRVAWIPGGGQVVAGDANVRHFNRTPVWFCRANYLVREAQLEADLGPGPSGIEVEGLNPGVRHE